MAHENLLIKNKRLNNHSVHTFHQLLEQQSELTPNEIAIIYYENFCTYKEFNKRSNQLARYLQQLGIEKGMTVGLYVDRSLELPIILMSVLKCGAICVPIDVNASSDRINFIIEDTKLSHIIVHPMELTELCGYTNVKFIRYDEAMLARYSGDNLDLPISFDDIAYILFTSGSTGRPKGVELEHKGFINTCIAMANIIPEDVMPLRLLQFSSIGFDAIIPEIGIPILRGGTLVITKKIDQLPGQPMIDTINNNRISIVILLPSILKVMQDASFPHLKVIMSGGEVCAPSVVNKLKNRFILFNIYGPTEASVAVTSYKIDKKIEYTARVPIGKSLGDAELYILDSDLKPVKNQEIGELYIGGTGLARKYRNSEQTAKSFLQISGKRLYKTGDFVRMLEDGNIEYIGRKDRQIKFHGIRISLDEIEIALSEHEYIAISAAVFENDILSVYTQLKPGKKLNEAELRSYLRKKLPAGVSPNKCFFLSKIPLNLNGKTDYQMLDHYQSDSVINNSIDAVWTNDECVLYDILRRLLNINQIEADTNFFDVGMDSFSIINFIIEVNKAFNIDMRVGKFYEHTSIKSMANYIKSLTTEQAETVIDFSEEACINEVLTKQHYANFNSRQSAKRNILLTGATGFLGAFLLDELLNNTDAIIYCLVRAKETNAALQRIEETAKKYQIDCDFVKHASRLQAIPCDLTKPFFGLDEQQFVSLSRTVNMIYHAASDVSFIKPYVALKPANVLGSKEILRLATFDQLIPIHYISTLSVFSYRHLFEKGLKQIDEFTDTIKSASCLTHEIGYVQSKWVADYLMQQAIERGVPITIYRPGLILCHSETGATSTQQFWHAYVKECLRLGVYPNLVDQLEEFISVDYTAKAIYYLSQRDDSIGKIYHLCPKSSDNISSTVFIQEIIKLLGIHLELLPYKTWLQLVIKDLPENKKDNYLYSFFPLLSEKIYDELTALEIYQHTPQFVNKFTYELLAKGGILPTPIDQLIKMYCNNLLNAEY
jgi:amino acid adenylation domain-containing protein/thioester reductase-like protein